MKEDVNATFKLKRRELADFLKTRRAAVQPIDVGLPCHPRKRTPGLRREDVAELADLSVSWYSWLEQAREISVSDDALNSIAAALRLSDAERAHLFNLAKSNENILKPENTHDLKEIKRILNSFAADIPATATGRYMNILAWNSAAGRLHGDFKMLPEAHRNWAWYIFKYQRQEFFTDWETFARCTLALVRSDYGKFVGADDEGAKLIEELRAEIPLFETWWHDHSVISVPHPNKEFNHEQDGKLRYITSAMHLESAPEVRFVVYTPIN